MTTQCGLIGARVQYESGGQLYQGIILDKVRVLMRGDDIGEGYDLYLVQIADGKVFKISPAQVKGILTTK